jgi:hypothetical protein
VLRDTPGPYPGHKGRRPEHRHCKSGTATPGCVLLPCDSRLRMNKAESNNRPRSRAFLEFSALAPTPQRNQRRRPHSRVRRARRAARFPPHHHPVTQCRTMIWAPTRICIVMFVRTLIQYLHGVAGRSTYPYVHTDADHLGRSEEPCQPGKAPSQLRIGTTRIRRFQATQSARSIRRRIEMANARAGQGGSRTLRGAHLIGGRKWRRENQDHIGEESNHSRTTSI